MAFESKTAASRLMLNVDVPSKVGALVVLGVGKVVVDTQKQLLHLDPWALQALPADQQVAKASGVVLEVEAAASEVDLTVVAMGEEVVVALVFKEAGASEDKTGMELLRQTLPRAQVVLVEVGFLVVEEVMVVRPVHQIVTVLGVGMIHVEEVAHTMTEAAAGIVATNEMDLPVVVLGATWSR
jgi:hypothetical protein